MLAARARRAIEQDETVFLVSGKPAVGLAQLRFRQSIWTGKLDCYLEDFYVAASHRGRGVGRALLRRAMDLARKRGAVYMDLATGETDTAARALYESLGFDDFEMTDGVRTRMLFYSRDL